MSTNFPNSFYAGDSVDSTDYYEDFLPANGWLAEYVFTSSNNKITLINSAGITADIVNNKYIVEISSNLSETFKKGFYDLDIRFSNANLGKRRTVYQKKIEILDDISSLSYKDNRNWAQIALDNINAVFQKTANPSQKMYEINGRKLENFSWKELIDLKKYLESEVRKLEGKKTGKGRGRILVEFK